MCIRDSGNYRTESNPFAVKEGRSSGSAELGGNHCGALQKKIVVEPGEESRLIFMLGVGPREKGKEIRSKYSDLANVDKEFAALKMCIRDSRWCARGC